MTGLAGLDFYRTANCGWRQGLVRLRKATWHSCMQWGWPAINRGEHLARWEEYWVLSFKWRRHGISWQWWPHRTLRRRR